MIFIQDLHDEILDLLLEYREQHNPELRFSLRQSNRYNRLEDGYWFYGNEYYLAVSFWTGTDWKNKTPNVFFVILSDQSTYLEISTSDSAIKTEFVNLYLLPELGISKDLKKHRKIYNDAENPGYLKSFREFLERDKKTIDRILKDKKGFFDNQKPEDTIGFFDDYYFSRSLRKIDQFRDDLRLDPSERSSKLANINISGFGPLREEIRTEEIPKENQWIFLTGMNGVGKSSVLKAISVALTQKKIEDFERIENVDYSASFQLYNRNGSSKYTRINNERASNRLRPFTSTFAAYGPLRLHTLSTRLNKRRLKEIFKKTNYLDSLREKESYLLDINRFINVWSKQKKHQPYLEERKSMIQEVLRDALGLRFDVQFENDSIVYIEKDSEGRVVGELPFELLSTGLKATIGLLGDLMVRLYEQMPRVSDPSLFEGIVVIDEIDVHLHPSLQKQLIVELSRTFSKLQFIVTTHSPIPLLGAPKDKSVFYVINRNEESGVTLQHLDMDITDLLPNTLLSSPIFGFNEIISKYHDRSEKLRTENDYDEVVFNKILERKISEKRLELGLDNDSDNK